MFRKAILTGAIGLMFATAGTVQIHANENAPHRLIDFVVLKDATALAERNAYEAKMAPIAEQYGARVIHSYDITGHIAGPMEEAVRLNVWAFSEPDALAKLNEDARYQALVPVRDRIHDMEALTLYLAENIRDGGPITDGVILVDLVAMTKGNGDAERDAYEAKMAPIAKRYGFEVVSSFRISQKLAGEGPDSAMRLSLWEGQSPDGLQQLNTDPGYVALAEERDRITDFANLALFMAEPR